LPGPGHKVTKTASISSACRGENLRTSLSGLNKLRCDLCPSIRDSDDRLVRKQFLKLGQKLLFLSIYDEIRLCDR